MERKIENNGAHQCIETCVQSVKHSHTHTQMSTCVHCIESAAPMSAHAYKMLSSHTSVIVNAGMHTHPVYEKYIRCPC